MAFGMPLRWLKLNEKRKKKLKVIVRLIVKR